jgi:hypothetical protein
MVKLKIFHPHLDRIIPKKGYVYGNLLVKSRYCKSLKV